MHDLDAGSVPVGVSQPEASGASSASRPVILPPATVRSGLPFLWPGAAVAPDPPVVEQGLQAPQPPPLPAATVRSGLPFLWTGVDTQTPTADCEQYLRGDCPHGISGKVNGICSGVHKKRCNKYMKWGSEHEKGCKDCDKVHPMLCPRSLQLKCLDQACVYKLHTSKCVRKEPVPVVTAATGAGQNLAGAGHSLAGAAGHILAGTGHSPAWGTQSTAHSKAGAAVTRGGGQGAYGHHSHYQYSIPPPPYSRAGLGTQSSATSGYQGQQNNSDFQGMTVQHLLEAQAIHFQQELAKQKEEVRIVQQQLKLQLLPYPAVEGLVWGHRPSY